MIKWIDVFYNNLQNPFELWNILKLFSKARYFCYFHHICYNVWTLTTLKIVNFKCLSNMKMRMEVKRLHFHNNEDAFPESYKCNILHSMFLEIVVLNICLDSCTQSVEAISFAMLLFYILLHYCGFLQRQKHKLRSICFYCEKLKLENKEEKFNYILMVFASSGL